MKKTLLFAALVLISAGCVAQKANVKKAKSMAMNTESPDFATARQLIGEAIHNEETKSLAETYYVAGLIGYQENQKMSMDAMLGGVKDQAKAGHAITESYDYWLQADKLAMTPTLDKKGREVVDKKTRDMITKKMLDYYKAQDFVQYGIYLNDQRDFANAYRAFMKHLNMRNLDMFVANPKLQEQMPMDTTYYQYLYYAGLFATQAEMHPEAVAVFEQLKDGEVEAIACNQFLYQEYVNLKDTVKFVQVLKDAMVKFPQEPWFLQNLINFYLFSDQEAEALNYLNQAIAQEPNVAQYHYIKGNLDENRKAYEDALADFQRAIELDPNMADAYAGMGRVYYNQAVAMNEKAAYINDAKEYKAALAEMNEMFKKSLPHFEKAHQVDPQDRNYMVILKGLYYRFSMEDDYNRISAEMDL